MSSDSPSRPAPEQDLAAPASPDDAPSQEATSHPFPDAPRLGEAGNAYMGRQANDAVTTNERVLDADRVLGDQGLAQDAAAQDDSAPPSDL